VGHIHVLPGQFDLTVSAYIIRTADQGTPPALLLHRHKTLGVLLQPGGHVELDETPWQAMMREIREETGYEPDQLRLLQPRLRLSSLPGGDLHPVPVGVRSFPFGDLPHFHTDLTYAFVTNADPRSAVGAGESRTLAWFTRDQLTDPALELYADVRVLALFILDHLLVEWEAVPTTPAYPARLASSSRSNSV
jgi:8-oxo-dGTP pyrophosphatase MutT (NUDIX family)